MRKVGLASLAFLTVLASPALAETTLTVMSFNISGGGANEAKPIDETVRVIKAAGADIIGIQETRLKGAPCTADHCPPAGPSVAPATAEALGFHLYEQTVINDALWANAILSRYPIGAATANDLGVAIDVDGRTVYAFNIYLDNSPYQPYQLLGIEYGDAPFIKTEAEAIRFAKETRGPALKPLFQDRKAAKSADAARLQRVLAPGLDRACGRGRAPAAQGALSDDPRDRALRLRRYVPRGLPG